METQNLTPQQSRFLQDMEERKRVYEEREARRKAVEEDRHRKIIDMENFLTAESNRFLAWLADNESKLKGKKLYLATGGKSKYFEELWNTYPKPERFNLFGLKTRWNTNDGYMNLSMSSSVWGGNGEDRTNYNVNVERTLMEVITMDKLGVFTGIRTKPSDYRHYDYDTYAQVAKDVKSMKEQIKELEEKISRAKANIPYSLYDSI